MRIYRSFLSVLLSGVATLSVTLSSCSDGIGSEDQLTEDADSFSTAYFNWQFQKASRYATPESEQWLRYASSQVHQEDVDLLRAQPEGASCELGNIEYNESDSSATLLLTVHNFLEMDTIGKVGHIQQEAQFVLPMRFHKGEWKVNMNGMLRKKKTE